MTSVSLQGRAALVTGASRGLGRAVAWALAEAGADVALVGRSSGADLAESVAGVEARGRRAVGLAGDVSREEEARRLVDGAVGGLGRLDILVNNAGHTARVSWGMDLAAINLQDLDRTWEVDVRGTFLMCREAHSHLVRGRGPCVVNVSSGAALEGDPAVLLYAAAKEGVHGLTKALAALWAPAVRVNAVAPGSVRTGWVETWGVPEEDIRRIEARTPLKRLGEPGDVASAVLYLASDMASFVTGQTLVVDGGVWRT
jgi:NAD(P)-dependent dehydrogenase (short-subunit alcohol dehydrogenase family)